MRRLGVQEGDLCVVRAASGRLVDQPHARLLERLDERHGGAVHARHFLAVQLDDGVVDLERVQRREPEVEVQADSEPNYGDYELPATRRASSARGAASATAEKLGEDYFDIPAFLRRQAD